MKHPLQLRFSDIDRLGHVTNSVYSQFLDIGRLAYIETYLPELDFNARTLVLVRIESDFVHPSLYGEQLYVDTKVERIGTKSVSMRQEIISAQGEVKCRSLSIMSTLDQQTGKSFILPEEWKDKLQRE
ncbi:MAG: thioesterase family protein [Bacteroidales bacterium]